MRGVWQVNGREADRPAVAEALALGRQHTSKIARADREARQRDADARAVARTIRRDARGQARSGLTIPVRPASVSARRKGGVRLRKFEVMVGLTHPAKFSSSGRASSFHFKLAGRGIGGRRRAKDRPYQQGEAVCTVRYILRDAAREIEGGGLISNIANDPDAIASLFAALEELEMEAGRKNANVYMTLVVSLPHELSADERERLLEQTCVPLAENDLPYAAVLHRADPEGDQRNVHAHVIFSWRPVVPLGGGGYDVEARTRADLNCATFVTRFRKRAADAMNEAMEQAGHARRFTPLSRAARCEEPGRPEQGKKSAGKKHSERRQDNIAEGLAERALIDQARAVRQRLAQAAEVRLTRFRRAQPRVRSGRDRIQARSRLKARKNPRAGAGAGRPDPGDWPGRAADYGRPSPTQEADQRPVSHRRSLPRANSAGPS